MHKGFYTMPRGLLDEPHLCGNPSKLVIWLKLVELAVFKEHHTQRLNNKSFSLKRGQAVISLHKFARQLEGWDISIQNIRTALKHFEEDGYIKVHSNKAGTIVTICNYEGKYHRSNKANTQTTNAATDNQQSANRQNKERTKKFKRNPYSPHP